MEKNEKLIENKNKSKHGNKTMETKKWEEKEENRKERNRRRKK